MTPSRSSNGPVQARTMTGTVWPLARVMDPMSEPQSATVPLAVSVLEALGAPDRCCPKTVVRAQVALIAQAPAAVNAAELFQPWPTVRLYGTRQRRGEVHLGVGAAAHVQGLGRGPRRA